MDLTLQPDTYVPSIDENGNYIDKIILFTHGLRCLCGSRKDKTYDSITSFSTHIKTKTHTKWLEYLNLNKANYYVECENLKITLKNQQTIIAKLEKDLQTKSTIMNYLTQQLHQQNTANNSQNVNNLLSFD
jgi:hypothetical protein